MKRPRIRPLVTPGGILSVKFSKQGSRHVLREGPIDGPGAKTLCGRDASHVYDRATYCWVCAWRQRGWICYGCNQNLWRHEWADEAEEAAAP